MQIRAMPTTAFVITFVSVETARLVVVVVSVKE